MVRERELNKEDQKERVGESWLERKLEREC